MDVTNTVGSSMMVISKERIAQLKEENATLLMAIAERNKIVELSNVDLQKLQFTVEKSYQQNRMLAQANSQMLAELTSMKERLKTMQHELGCTVAVLRMKNLALDEKEKLNKELCEKIRIGEEHANNAVDATIIRPTQLEKELYNEFVRMPEPSTPRVRRIQQVHQYLTLILITCPPTTLGGVHLERKERLKKESSEKNKDAKELSKCAEVGTDTSKCHIVDSDMACETNRRRTLRSHNKFRCCGYDDTHKMGTKEKDTTTERVIRRSSNNNLTSQEQETKEEDPIQAKPSITVDPQVESEEKDDTRTRKSSRREIQQSRTRSISIQGPFHLFTSS